MQRSNKHERHHFSLNISFSHMHLAYSCCTHNTSSNQSFAVPLKQPAIPVDFSFKVNKYKGNGKVALASSNS